LDQRAWTVVVESEGDGFVSRCPELDIASQGMTREEALVNLREAVALFFEVADANEVAGRLGDERRRNE
jgi:predicted RNase H-like HicB family nuclease